MAQPLNRVFGNAAEASCHETGPISFERDKDK